MDPLPGTAAFIEFGRFTLLPHRHELLADGQPIELGGRAFDVLLALIDSPGAVLTKDELMGRVWPGRVVEENSLQAQVSALRKALGGDRDLIRTVAGRGYQFTGEMPMRGVTTSPRRASNLPEPISELIGRETAMAEVSDLMMAHRLVTLAGIGGIKQDTVGAGVAWQLLPRFSDQRSRRGFAGISTVFHLRSSWPQRASLRSGARGEVGCGVRAGAPTPNAARGRAPAPASGLKATRRGGHQSAKC